MAYHERDRPLIRPLRFTFTHDICGKNTDLISSIARSFAENPKFHSSAYCAHCCVYSPVSNFKWKDSDELVGS